MQYIKTYGARGVLEWHLTLRVGKARLRVTFSGGRMGANGVVPAKYVTDNAAVQQVIESSDYFKSGRIYLHGDPVKIEDITEKIRGKDENFDRGTDSEMCAPDGGDAEQFN